LVKRGVVLSQATVSVCLMSNNQQDSWDWADAAAETPAARPEGTPVGNVPVGDVPSSPTSGEVKVEPVVVGTPVPEEPTPWVSQPKYGQYAPGGAPVYGDPGYSAPTYGAPAYGQPTYGQMPYAPAPPPPVAPVDPKPGIVPLRHLGLGDILAGAWHAVWHNPAVMLGLPALILLVTSILSALFGLALQAPFANLNDELMRSAGMSDVLGAYPLNLDAGNLAFISGAGAAGGILNALAQPIIAGILAVAVSQAVLGNRPSRGEVWGRVKPRIGALIGWAILYTVITVVAAALFLLAIVGLAMAAGNVSGGFAAALVILLLLAMIVVFLWIGVKLLFVAPVIAIEGATIGQAVRRSWDLSRGNFWRIFGIYLLAMILLGFITGLIGAPLSLISSAVSLGTGGSLVPYLLDIVRLVITNTLTMVFTSGIVTLLYIDSRMRNENLHETLREHAIA